MKILHTVEFYYPSVGGMQEVVRQLSEWLAARGHEVTVATTAISSRTSSSHNGVSIKAFNITGNAVAGLKGEVGAYRDFVTGGGFDVIVNFAAQQWATDALLPVLNEISAKKVFVPTGFSGLYRKAFNDYYKKMPEILRAYDAIVFLSDNYRDINFARKHGPGNFLVIPNGAAEEEFLSQSSTDIRSELGIGKDEFMIIHLGSYTGYKGHREAVKIFQRAKLKNAVLVLAMSDTRDILRSGWWKWQSLINRIFHRKKIIVAALDRSKTVDALKAADLFLFPSLVECSPLVLFESLAAQTPFLASDCGNSAEIVEWTGGGEILPTRTDEEGYSHVEIGKSARQLEQLASDKHRLDTYARKGFDAWKNRFTWERIADEYEKLYIRLKGEKA